MFQSLLANIRTLGPTLWVAGAVMGVLSFGPSITRAEGEQSLEAGDTVAVVLQSADPAVPKGAPLELSLVRLQLSPPEVVIPTTITRGYRTADLDDVAPRFKSQPRPLGWL